MIRPVLMDPLRTEAVDFVLRAVEARMTPFEVIEQLGIRWPNGAPDWEDVILALCIRWRRAIEAKMPKHRRQAA